MYIYDVMQAQARRRRSQSTSDGQLVEYVEKVDPKLKREEKARDTVRDHGLVNCQEAQCLSKVLGADS
jgi:hypothetical protein